MSAAPQTVSNIGAQVNLQLRQGANFSTTLTFTNPDSSPTDLTGCVLSAQIRRNPREQMQPVASFTLTIATPASGVAIMALPAAATAQLDCGDTLDDPASQYVWDLEFTNAAGNVSSPLYGAVQIFREVTR